MKKARLQFLPGKQKSFIDQIHEKSKLSTLELAELAGVHRRSFIDWRKEKLRMTLTAAEIFIARFQVVLPERKEVLLRRWENKLKEANKVGGVAHFKKYGSPGTFEGRSKGGKVALSKLREKGLISPRKNYLTPEHTESLAEFVGILLGDGGITQEQCFITLNSEADREYVYFVMDLGTNLFGEKPHVHKHVNDKGIALYYSGLSLIEYFLKLGLKIGSKVKQQVDVPEWIKNNSRYKTACLRGLMDTDGGVFLHKYQVNNKKYAYKKISFANRSIPLIGFVQSTLNELGFNSKLADKFATKRVWLYNEQEVNQYFRIVGTHNTRLSRLIV